MANRSNGQQEQQQNGSQTDEQRSKNRPVHTIRYGMVKAAGWRNVVDMGNLSKPMYNVTFSRLYKDGDEWRDTLSFGYDDLLNQAKCANEAHTWIADQLVRDREDEQSEPEQQQSERRQQRQN